MSDKQLVNGKFMRVLSWAAGITGVIGDAAGYAVFGENKLRVTHNMAATETLQIHGRLSSSSSWTLIGSTTGSAVEATAEFNVRTWDYIRFNVSASVAGGTIYSSGFFNYGSADTFTDLDDTPSNFTGAATKVLTVNAAENGIEFVTNSTTDENIKISAADTTAGKLNDKVVVSSGVNTANILETSILNPAGNEDLQIQIDEGKIDHDSLLNWHNLTTDIDHDAITNTHNLTTDIDHGSIDGILDDDHTQYPLLVGRATGQTLSGGNAASENLTLQSTSDVTKGNILLGSSAYDEVNDRLGIATITPGEKLEVVGNIFINTDSNKLILGEGKDSSISYDGSDLNIKSNDVAASDILVTCGSEKTIELQNTVWDDINISGAILSKPASSAPGQDEFVDNLGADTGIETYAFAVGEKLHGSFELIHTYKEGTDLKPHIHFQIIADPGGTKYVKWQMTYTIAKGGTTLSPVEIVVGECAVDTQYENYFCILNDPADIPGLGLEIGDQFLFTIERIASVGDAFAGEALLQTVGIHHQVDTMGSRQVSIK